MANKQICSVDVVDSVTDEDKFLVNVDGKLRQIKVSELNSNLVEQKMLGWSVPKECPVQNYVDSDGVFHQKVGRVCLIDYEWVYNLSDGQPCFNIIETVSDCKGSSDWGNSVANGYCNGYRMTSWENNRTNANYDMSIAISPSGIASIRNSTYTDATTFKNAMKGVYLYYELEEEKTINVDGNEAVTKVNESLSVIGKYKNLLNPTLQTTTQNGITCTNNGDGTYTLNGTASKQTIFYIVDSKGIELNINNNAKFIGCPSGGSSSTYSLTLYNETNNKWYDDYGNGRNISDISKITIYIQVYSGVTVSNLTFKPMLVFDDKTPNATYDDFVPYTGDGETLTHDVAELKNDLGSLSFSVSGTTLSITDGTNTWTLNQ